MAAIAYGAKRPVKLDPDTGILVVKTLAIVDSKGRPRIILDASNNATFGAPSIAMYDVKQECRYLAGLNKDGKVSGFPREEVVVIEGGQPASDPGADLYIGLRNIEAAIRDQTTQQMYNGNP